MVGASKIEDRESLSLRSFAFSVLRRAFVITAISRRETGHSLPAAAIAPLTASRTKLPAETPFDAATSEISAFCSWVTVKLKRVLATPRIYGK